MLNALAVAIIPVAVALLLAALFAPPAAWLTRHGWRRRLAAAAVLLGGLAAVGGLPLFVVRAVIIGLPGLRAKLSECYGRLRDWLATGPLGVGPEQLDRLATPP